MIDTENKANIHFKNRMKERHGIYINRKARAELLNLINNNKYKYIANSVDSMNRILISIPIFLSTTLCKINDNIKFGDRVLVIYDKKVRKIITVYPDMNIGEIRKFLEYRMTENYEK
jgi:hypothetical protein